MRDKLITYINKAFGLDLRGLAVFRIGIALILISDIFTRVQYLRAHYSDWGLLPRYALLELRNLTHAFSFHLISGSAVFQGLLFLASFVFALMLLFGIRTRLATVLSWILLVSLHNRNPIILNGGDSLLRMLLFWAMFLPLGAYYSIDRLYAQDSSGKQKAVCSIATLGLISQIVLMYVFTALLKTSAHWWPEGSALYYALSIDQFVTPIGSWLLQFDELLKYMTWGTFLLEKYACIFLFIPLFTGFFRTLTLTCFIGLHLGIFLTMHVGLFPLIDIVALTALFPSTIWNLWEKYLLAKLQKPLAKSNLIKTTSKIANQIYQWGKKPKKLHFKLKPATSVVLGLFILYMLALNVQSVKHWQYSAPKFLRPIEKFLKSHQYWSMFSPFPMKDDGWYIIRGQLDDDTEVDVYNQRLSAPSTKKPQCVACTYPNQRWRKYLMNLRRDKYKKFRLYYGKYLCRRWNDRPPDGRQLLSFQIYYMMEKTLPNYQTDPVKKRRLWRHFCFKRS